MELLPTFADDTRLTPHAAKNIGRMYVRHGHGPENAICGSCRHLERHVYGTTFFKCVKARVSRSAATDWRVRWKACGLFEPVESPTPRLRKRGKPHAEVTVTVTAPDVVVSFRRECTVSNIAKSCQDISRAVQAQEFKDDECMGSPSLADGGEDD